MKVVVSAMGDTPESEVDPRFGRCRYLIFHDPESDGWEAVPNSNIDAAGGAGIRTAQLVLDRGAEAVITGNMGPNAMEVLSSAGIPVHTGASGTVRSALEAFLSGRLPMTGGPTVPGHAGLPGGGPPAGAGTGFPGPGAAGHTGLPGVGPGSGGRAGGPGCGRGRGGRGGGPAPW